MSKGGAGKVYFVLYLAVILELLIIFIERDEAEEGLNRERQQAIQVVQTILSQLQTGSGSESITATPKDNIVLNDKDPQSNARNYEVTVAVGDPKAKSIVNGQEIKGDDISKLEYIVSHIGDDKILPEDLGPDSTDIEKGQVIFKAVLGTEVGSYVTPRQTFGTGVPAAEPQKYFMLNEQKTQDELARGHRVKVFTVNFKPNQGKGWYRLRFYSETNKILGITGGEANDNDTVRIGNVKLSVKQLRQVQKALRKNKGVGDEAARVEQYIDTLLTPGAYRRLAENLGSKAFDVHVTVPDVAPPQQPFAAIKLPRDTAYWYDVAPFSVNVTLGPDEGTHGVQGAALKQVDKASNAYVATIDNLTPGVIPIIAKATNRNGTQAQDEKFLVVEKPEVKGGPDKWKGNRATVTKKYNPSSEWVSTAIAPEDYETVVEIKGKTVFDRPGTAFKEGDLPAELVIPEGTTEKDIRTTIYWKPNKTADRTQWKPLLSNVPGTAILSPSKPFTVSYPPPEQGSAEYEFKWVLTPRTLKYDIEGIVLRQPVGQNQYAGVQASVTCDECDAFGITAKLDKVDELTYTLHLEADARKLKKEIRGKKFEFAIDMVGRGGAKGSTVLEVTTSVP
jgi:hypothetical protein